MRTDVDKKVSKIHAYSNIEQLLLKQVFKKIPIIDITLKSFNKINNKDNFIMIFNSDYQQLYDYFKISSINFTLVHNSDELLKIAPYSNIFIDINTDYYIIKILKQMGYWIITSNLYPNCELVNENINGNIIINSTYIHKNNHLINNSSANIEECIKIIEKYTNNFQLT